MTYNRYSLELMSNEDEDEILDVVQLSNGKFLVLTAEDIDI